MSNITSSTSQSIQEMSYEELELSYLFCAKAYIQLVKDGNKKALELHEDARALVDNMVCLKDDHDVSDEFFDVFYNLLDVTVDLTNIIWAQDDDTVEVATLPAAPDVDDELTVPEFTGTISVNVEATFEPSFSVTTDEDPELYFCQLDNEMEEEYHVKVSKVQNYSVVNPKSFCSLHLEAVEAFYAEEGYQTFSSEYPSSNYAGYHEALDKAIQSWVTDYIYNAIENESADNFNFEDTVQDYSEEGYQTFLTNWAVHYAEVSNQYFQIGVIHYSKAKCILHDIEMFLYEYDCEDQSLLSAQQNLEKAVDKIGIEYGGWCDTHGYDNH
jgi:hypothetical protein